ncbi:hypothetical protein JOB18_034365 [Solea senegalensis]|uniref:Uncharacterized protein n=1 Tax=Solea senegalensis TaxID=28829 RepID=A0AAV6PSY7_SOLSE|nr:hypothetical protein JOB18_034365 [Solea senegalensis]
MVPAQITQVNEELDPRAAQAAGCCNPSPPPPSSMEPCIFRISPAPCQVRRLLNMGVSDSWSRALACPLVSCLLSVLCDRGDGVMTSFVERHVFDVVLSVRVEGATILGWATGVGLGVLHMHQNWLTLQLPWPPGPFSCEPLKPDLQCGQTEFSLCQLTGCQQHWGRVRTRDNAKQVELTHSLTHSLIFYHFILHMRTLHGAKDSNTSNCLEREEEEVKEEVEEEEEEMEGAVVPMFKKLSLTGSSDVED